MGVIKNCDFEWFTCWWNLLILWHKMCSWNVYYFVFFLNFPRKNGLVYFPFIFWSSHLLTLNLRKTNSDNYLNKWDKKNMSMEPSLNHLSFKWLYIVFRKHIISMRLMSYYLMSWGIAILHKKKNNNFHYWAWESWL